MTQEPTARIQCRTCGRKALVNRARSVALGWPTCCRKEMEPVEPQIPVKTAYQKSELTQ